MQAGRTPDRALGHSGARPGREDATGPYPPILRQRSDTCLHPGGCFHYTIAMAGGFPRQSPLVSPYAGARWFSGCCCWSRASSGSPSGATGLRSTSIGPDHADCRGGRGRLCWPCRCGLLPPSSFAGVFQFSILSLLLLMVVAMACGWLAAERQRARNIARCWRRLASLGVVDYDYDLAPLDNETQREPPWLRRLLGDDPLAHVMVVDFVGQQSATPRSRISREWPGSYCFARRHRGRRRRVERLRGMTRLQYLDLSGTKVSDAGLQHLRGLTNLLDLNLSGTKVSDAGVRDLERATKGRDNRAMMPRANCPMTANALSAVSYPKVATDRLVPAHPSPTLPANDQSAPRSPRPAKCLTARRARPSPLGYATKTVSAAEVAAIMAGPKPRPSRTLSPRRLHTYNSLAPAVGNGALFLQTREGVGSWKRRRQ